MATWYADVSGTTHKDTTAEAYTAAAYESVIFGTNGTRTSCRLLSWASCKSSERTRMVSSQLLQVVTDVKTILTLGVREGSRLSWAHAGSIPVTVREVRRRNNSRIYCLIKRGLGNHYRATVVTMSAPDTFQKQRKIRARSQLLTEADSILANTVVYRVRKKAAARQSCSAPSPDYCSPEDIGECGRTTHTVLCLNIRTTSSA